jgi:hypothetical protein
MLAVMVKAEKLNHTAKTAEVFLGMSVLLRSTD